MVGILRLAAMAAALLGLASAVLAAPRPMRTFDVRSFDGRSVSSDDLKGRPVVLMFLSTDCPHCQETAQRLDPIYRELRQNGLEMIGFSLNKVDDRDLREFAVRFQASFPIAISSREEFSRITGVSVMTRIYYPYMVFVDRQGVIREEHQGYEQAWFDSLEVNFRAAVSAMR